MIVVDTNILVYRCVAGPRNAPAEALARLDPEWTAPPLWRSEFRNVLAGPVRHGRLSPADAAGILDRAAAVLRGGTHAVADSVVFGLVVRSPCPAYDCEFAGLARALGAVLVTEDRALLSAFPAFCRSLDEAVRHGLSS